MKLFPDSPNQALRLRRALLANIGLLVLTFLETICFKLGYFWAGGEVFAGFFAIAWSGNLAFLILIRSGLNRRFQDPSLTIYQMIWAAICILGAVYFTDHLHMLLLALYAVSTLFGAFKLRLGEFLAVTSLASVGYALVIIILIANRPEAVNPVVEWIQCLGFLIVMLGFSVMGAEHSKLRRRVGRQNRELTQALDTISELANTDALTGLYNRRYIIDLLEHQKAQAGRGEYNFVLCYIDLDYFKKINDRFGHSAGDMALCRVAEMACQQVRDMDYLARFGGEEFLLVLSNLKLPQGLLAAERLRRGVESCDFSDIHPELRITVSVGAAQYKPGESVDDTLRRADEALYRAKEKGRNRVEAEGLGPQGEAEGLGPQGGAEGLGSQGGSGNAEG